jgi:hypothetical protein
MAFEKLRTIVITAIPKPRSRERFRKIAETIPTPRKRATRKFNAHQCLCIWITSGPSALYHDLL